MKSSWLQITSGRGPAECAYAVRKIAEILEIEMKEAGIRYSLLDAVGDKRHQDALVSVLYSLQDADEFLKSWRGTAQWIGQSPYRPHHKRKNWFVSLNVFSEPDEVAWSSSDLQIETMRSSGPGGQHANKTESAVRVTHLPTGLQTIAREERSQYQNKKLAIARMQALLFEERDRSRSRLESEAWQGHNTLVRGNPVQIFRGPEFRRSGS